MKYLVVISLLLIVMFLGGRTEAAPAIQLDEDKEESREVAGWLLGLIRRPDANIIYSHKRNSELINSLLGLPKVLNDAGKFRVEFGTKQFLSTPRSEGMDIVNQKNERWNGSPRVPEISTA